MADITDLDVSLIATVSYSSSIKELMISRRNISLMLVICCFRQNGIKCALNLDFMVEIECSVDAANEEVVAYFPSRHVCACFCFNSMYLLMTEAGESSSSVTAIEFTIRFASLLSRRPKENSPHFLRLSVNALRR